MALNDMNLNCSIMEVELMNTCAIANPSNPKSDEHLISPYSNIAEPFIKMMRIKEMIANLRGFDC